MIREINLGNFFTELKRRNVFKVAVAYLVVGWIVMQTVDVVAPTLELPDWLAKGILLLLLAGLPVALFLAWAFELTPEGVKKTVDVKKEDSVTAQTGQKLNHLIIGAMGLAIAFLVFDRFRGEMAPPTSNPAAAIFTAGSGR